MAIPVEVSQILTFPEPVTDYNMEKMTKLVNANKANIILRNNEDGEITRINLKYALFEKGTELLYGDTIIRNIGTTLYEDDDGNIEIPKGDGVLVKTGKETFNEGYRLVRDKKLVENVTYRKQKTFKLRKGDVVERHLQDGDIVLLNRQPTEPLC